jgi:hypothetical protein
LIWWSPVFLTSNYFILYDKLAAAQMPQGLCHFFRRLFVFKGAQEATPFCLDTKSNQKTKRSDLIYTFKKQQVNKSRQRQCFHAAGHTPWRAALCRGRRSFFV